MANDKIEVSRSHWERVKRERDIALGNNQALQHQVESLWAWGKEANAEERRLADRLVFVYGVARAHGATIEELQQ